MSVTNHLLSAHSTICINRLRQSVHPALHVCRRRQESRLLTNPEQVQIVAADMRDSRQLEALVRRRTSPRQMNPSRISRLGSSRRKCTESGRARMPPIRMTPSTR
ncbi:hypothetical protein KBY93_12270 [Synechococcus sp. J7-Johnson]|uniref:hypothetical protein n=1 Tax=Synechococcus sp. J7-Johnson TaxID=2823737 RepID=UPI0020CDF379|nr:hypothetical protein [Synechococcus sp. J7-Johnson]MCP9841402.1 hypothetical protein [Synechococcus sp. J7-Johnson]